MQDFEVLDRFHYDDKVGEGVDLTIIVPTSNTASYVKSTLNCIAAQGPLRVEIIVVDYKSEDNTLAYVREFAHAYEKFPLTIVRQNRPGLGDARNYGIRLALGDYVAVLDSDDFFAPMIYFEMFHFAKNNDCDLMFCRGTVFNDKTAETDYFFDNWVWDKILGSRHSAVVTARREPDVFRLEPNASIRMLKRKFIIEKDIFYPEGKRAEDIVPHYRSLLEADRIGVISKRGFFYRVGRAGKLTSDPSKWIYDLLDATALSLSEACHYEPSDSMGASMIYLWMRAAFYYGTQIPYAARHAYYRSCSLIVSQIPKAWVDQALSETVYPVYPQRLRMKLALIAMRVQSARFLTFWSGNPRSVVVIAVRLIGAPSLVKAIYRQYGLRLKPKFLLEILRTIAYG